MNQYDYLEAGLKVFGIHKIEGGECSCEKKECNAAGKHPIASNWQHTPDWSEDQLDTMEEMGHFDTGFGVVVNGLIVVDVDARNGGIESYKKLCKDIGVDLTEESKFVVMTGSGNGSMHVYFRAPENKSLLQHHNEYEGIDFKSSGFVIGAGSLHKSGLEYEVLHGSPHDIEEAPAGLIEKLERPEYHRVEHNGNSIDVSEKDLDDMLKNIEPDCGYDKWIRIGMALHEATGGNGIDKWDEWSRRGDKYDGFESVERHWHSFGKTSNPVTIGTIVHYAKENGWQSSYDDVTFTTTLTDDDAPVIDLNRPPGFVGEVAKWIDSQCLYPRESLSVAAALTSVGNIVGLRHVDGMDGMTTNLFSFCVAGSSTGKEAVQQAFVKVMRAAGIAGAVHGAFKSEQEVIRNLTRHQMAAYAVDELGITLKKVKNSQARGGAAYLEGLIGVLMSAFSKADGYMPVSGDVREEIKKELIRERASCEKKIDDNEDKYGYCARRIERIGEVLANLDSGLNSPFLSIIGFTTPVTFNDLMDFEQATNGFLSRSLIFNDLETNPRRKKGFKKEPMSDQMAATLQQLYAMGEANAVDDGRIEYYGDKQRIESDQEAQDLMDTVYEYFWEMAEQHKSVSGLEAVPRRGYELVGKVSTILAAPEGLRTREHVQWAFELAKRDVEYKMKLAYANMKEENDEKTDAVRAKIMNCLSKDHGETIGVLVNRCRPHPKDLVQKAIDNLISGGHLVEKITTASNGRQTTRYYEC